MDDTTILLFCLTCITLAIFTFSFISHIFSYRRPSLQSCSVRLQLLVITSACCAMVSYRWPAMAPWMEIPKGFVEAYCLYTFWVLLIFYVGGAPAVHHIYRTESQCTNEYTCNATRLCCCCCTPYICPTIIQSKLSHHIPNAESLLTWHQRMVAQLMITRPLCFTFLAILTWSQEGGSPSNAQKNIRMLITAINLICMLIMMRTLLKTYVMLKIHLKGYRVVLKFAVIKIIVVLTVLQNSILSFLVTSGSIKSDDEWDADEIAARLNAIMTIIEALICSFILAWIFSPNDVALHMYPHPRTSSSSTSTSKTYQHEDETIADILVSPSTLSSDLLSTEAESTKDATAVPFSSVRKLSWWSALYHMIAIWDIIIYDLIVEENNVVNV